MPRLSIDELNNRRETINRNLDGNSGGGVDYRRREIRTHNRGTRERDAAMSDVEQAAAEHAEMIAGYWRDFRNSVATLQSLGEMPAQNLETRRRDYMRDYMRAYRAGQRRRKTNDIPF
jgi:hypothetical protein